MKVKGGMIPIVGHIMSVLGLASASLFWGCTSHTESKPQEESSIKVLGLLYGQYVGQHMGRPPQDEQAFRSFVQKQTAFLQQFHIDSPDQVFKSARDGEPYAVIYGDASKVGQLSGAPVIAWEKKGVGGRRYVANSLGAVKEVTDEEFKQLVPASE